MVDRFESLLTVTGSYCVVRLVENLMLLSSERMLSNVELVIVLCLNVTNLIMKSRLVAFLPRLASYTESWTIKLTFAGNVSSSDTDHRPTISGFSSPRNLLYAGNCKTNADVGTVVTLAQKSKLTTTIIC